ncbi:hypothetical protein D0Z00_001829 [Geotrichum galactomycetum]|uniref:Uncharacterized protein n=1 Tax=Geotrichum galactomycetum TaxID=27317 RepID=A0ACB6V5U4_9ASCO|nr:hypothetical protein D0Z00_001829 [Geotrichum candidum]
MLTPFVAASSDEEDVGDAYSNRGQKLKRGANEIHEGKLGRISHDRHSVKTVDSLGHKLAVVYKKRKLADTGNIKHDKSTNNSNNNKKVDVEEEVYKDIKLGDLLAPVSHPSEVPSHPAISRAFDGKTIRVLSRHALEIITEEQKHAVQFARLMSVFLGDDPTYRRSNMLNLPIYDHLDGIKDPAKEPAAEEDNKTENGSVIEAVKQEQPRTRRPSTRGQSAQEEDAFFALPQFKIDRDYGIRPDDAEDTRQLTQIAQQRSEEFIRCMNKVRFGLLRAERYQRQVFKWCKEMAGEKEDDDGLDLAKK